MKNQDVSDRFTTRSHRLANLISYLLIFAVGLRRINELDGAFGIGLALILLGLFTILNTIVFWLPQRILTYPRVYFAIQAILIQLLGIFQVYLDTWAILYIILGFQVAARFSRKEAIAWWSLFIISILVSLVIEFGPISGFGRALAYIVIGVFIISYDIQYAQHEDALADSQVLLAGLQEAHQKLADYTAQAEKLAAIQERNRMTQELYDSVGQKVFAIQLAAEATRLMLEKDPQRAAKQIDELQVQTQSTLGQMRQLIGQWRPG